MNRPANPLAPYFVDSRSESLDRACFLSYVAPSADGERAATHTEVLLFGQRISLAKKCAT